VNKKGYLPELETHESYILLKVLSSMAHHLKREFDALIRTHWTL
jgi:hypothetical protein